MTSSIERIIIRHLAGSKANQIEQLPVGEARDFSIGRDPSSTISFDPASDSVVSRQHAVIRMQVDADRTGFKIVDNDSSNGTYVNGKRVDKAAELLPEDIVELGKKGPRFVFDVQPRPANLVARTRTIDVEAPATRSIDTAQIAASVAASSKATTSTGAASGATGTSKTEPRRGVGQETVQRLIGEANRATRSTWVASVTALAAFLVLGGAALLWKQWSDEKRFEDQIAEVERGQAESSVGMEGRVRSITGMTPQEIYDKYGNATVKIAVQWRLFDKTTGKPIYHQTFKVKDEVLPAYVRLRDGRIVRWLTTEDDYRSNLEVGGEGTGSGFVVGGQGYILTNKHVAAGWEVPFDVPRLRGVLYEVGGGPGAAAPKRRSRDPDLRNGIIINLNDPEFERVADWLPESGGVVFPSKPEVAIPIGKGNVPDPSKAEKHAFAGRNEYLRVRFPGSRLDINADLIRVSSDSDAALVKIDTPQPLGQVEVATDDAVTVGERIIVLGYPGLSVENRQAQQIQEAGQIRSQIDVIPEATVTDGIVSKLATGVKERDGIMTYSNLGDVIQLSAVATGAGNSGGPVFNATGKVIGLFTYSRSRGNERVTLAVPIKYGRDLMRAQRE